MRWRGVHHIELSVLDYDNSIAFYDRMFGWLGYMSFWTLDLGYHSTYYMARFPVPHSYIGIQPAKSGAREDFEARRVGLHHLALWARSRREVDDFREKFLRAESAKVTDEPTEYPIYAPGYYAVFFDDPINGFHWELAWTPRIPSLGAWRRFRRAMKDVEREHPEWKRGVVAEAMRELPGRN